MIRFRRPAPVPVWTVLVAFALQLPAGAVLASEGEPLVIEGLPTNLGVAHSLCGKVSALVLAELGSELPDGCLLARAGGEHSGNALMELALAQAGREAGMAVATAPDDCARTLEFRILDLRIAYTGVDRAALGFKKQIERHAACVLAARVLDARTGREIGTTQQEVLLADRIPYEVKDLVSSPSYPFTNPELKEKDWSKSVEPFVVTAMISGLVYLFFSNQSSN